MRLKSFHAKTMSEAMKAVRQALGDDAIIVATREEEGGGVRVTAAVEEDDQYAPAASRVALVKPAEPEIDVGELVADALHRHGVPAALAEQLIDAAAGLDTEDATLALGAALDALFNFHPLPDGTSRGPARPLVFVGPPGAGKTLTIAKLAARSVFKKRSVAVITTDTARAGGVEQLSGFMRLLKIKLHRVDDPEALGGAIEMSQGVDLVLVDTAGRNPFDDQEMADLRALLGAAEVEPVLVLPGGIDAVEAAETGLAFRKLGAKRMLVTRLDIARRLGSLLFAAHRARLAFCDGTIAPKVAEGLTSLNPVALARLMMPGQEKAASKAAKPKAAAQAHAMSSPSSRTLP
ncbi:MAG TPA: AAA family ATPase [Azospirillum sp.]